MKESTGVKKQYKLRPEEFRVLVTGYGACLASDRITVDGKPVGYMYRESPRNPTDSGWHFFAGDESQDYVDAPKNLGIYNVNTIANYDPEITPLLDQPIGAAWARDSSGKFVPAKIHPID